MVARVLAESETQDPIGAYLRSKGLPLTVENYNRVHEATIMDNPEAWLATVGAGPSVEQAILANVPGVDAQTAPGPVAGPNGDVDNAVNVGVVPPVARRAQPMPGGVRTAPPSRVITNESVRGSALPPSATVQPNPPVQPEQLTPTQPTAPAAAPTDESGSSILGFINDNLPNIGAGILAALGIGGAGRVMRRMVGKPNAMALPNGRPRVPPAASTPPAAAATPSAPATTPAGTAPPPLVPPTRAPKTTTTLPTGEGVVKGPRTPLQKLLAKRVETPAAPKEAMPESEPIELQLKSRKAANEEPTSKGIPVYSPQIFEALGLNPKHFHKLPGAEMKANLMSHIKSTALSLGIQPTDLIVLAYKHGKKGVDALRAAKGRRTDIATAADTITGSPRSKTLTRMQQAEGVPLTDAQGNPVAALSPMGHPRGVPTENVVNQPRGPTRKVGASAPPVTVTSLLGDTPGTAAELTGRLLDLMRIEEAKVRANAPGAMSKAQFDKLADMIRDELGAETRAGLASAPMVEARLANLPADKVKSVLDQLFLGRNVGEAVGADIGKKVAAPGKAETTTRPEWQNKLASASKPPGVITFAPGTVDQLRAPKQLEQKLPKAPKQAEPVESAPIDITDAMDIRNAEPSSTYIKQPIGPKAQNATRPKLTAKQKKAAEKQKLADAQKLLKPEAPAEAPKTETPPAAPKRGKTAKAETPAAPPATAPRRGRPPGSRNRPKTEAAPPPATSKKGGAKTAPPAAKTDAATAPIETKEVIGTAQPRVPKSSMLTSSQAKELWSALSSGGPRYQSLQRMLAAMKADKGTLEQQFHRILRSEELSQKALNSMSRNKGKQ